MTSAVRADQGPVEPGGAAAARRTTRTAHRRWVAPLAARLTWLVGLLNLLGPLFHENRGRLQAVTTFVPGALTTASAAVTTVTGLLLLLLAHGLRLRKRRAWRLVVALLASSVVLHVLRGLAVVEALVAAALLVGLVAYRDEFQAEGDPRTRWRAVGRLGELLVADVVIGFALLSVRDPAGSPGLLDRLQHVGLGLVGVSGPLMFASGRRRRPSSPPCSPSSAPSRCSSLPTWRCVRPSRRPSSRPTTRYGCGLCWSSTAGRDSLAYFALRRDKSVVWSPTGKAAVSYRVVSGVCLASGDPLGRPGGLAGGDRRAAGPGRPARLGARRHRRAASGRAWPGSGPGWRRWSSATRPSSRSAEFTLDGPGDARGPPGRRPGAPGPATRPRYGGSAT